MAEVTCIQYSYRLLHQKREGEKKKGKQDRNKEKRKEKTPPS
jgi:hypothetical protein